MPISVSAQGLSARDDIVRLDAGSVLIDLLANDSDNQGRELSVTVGAPPPDTVTVQNNGDGSVTLARAASAPVDGDVTFAYTLHATGVDSASRTAAIRVCWGSATCHLSGHPDFTLSAMPESIPSGGSTTIAWSAVSNATACTATGGWLGPRTLAGGSESFTLSATTTYTLSCTGPAGSTVRSKTVTVTPPSPPSCFAPATITAQDGADASIPATCSGGVAPLALRWQFNPNGTDPAGFNNLADGAGLSGTSTLTLGIAPVTPARIGWYRLRATDASTPAQIGFSQPTRLQSASAGVIGETGSITISSKPRRFTFRRVGGFAVAPVVFAQPHGIAGADVSTVRIHNVTRTGFTARVQDAPNHAAGHLDEEVSYFAIEPGRWEISPGTFIEAGLGNVTSKVGAAQAGTWTDVVVTRQAGPYVYFSQPQTYNFRATAKSRMRGPFPVNAEHDRFEISNEVWDIVANTRARESVGWLVTSSKQGTLAGRKYAAGYVDGVTDAWTTLPFGSTFESPTRVVAGVAGYSATDRDGIALRRQNLTTSSMQVRLQEDTTVSPDVTHAPERVAFLAFGGDIALNATLMLKACTPPAFTTQPASSVTAEGGSVVLTAATSGSTPIAYQWVRDGGPVTGATGASLSLSPLQNAHGGVYSVVATNACASATSESAVVTVLSANQTTFRPTPSLANTAIEGEDVDVGGEGVAYHDHEPTNLGGVYRTDGVDVIAPPGAYALGVFEPGEWVEYSVWLKSGGANAAPTTPTFSDVTALHPRRGAIEAMAARGVTSGCAPGAFCPARLATRGAMAVFLIRAGSPPGYVPPACTTPVFADVPCSHPFAPYINELSRRGITAGCGGSPPNYCVDQPVTRAEMAVFVVRARLGSGYPLPDCASAPYTDVPCGHWAARFVAEAMRRGFVEPCDADLYCPTEQVTRAESSAFIVNGFDLGVAGAFDVDLRYSTQPDGERELELTLDSEPLVSVPLRRTHDWDNYQISTVAGPQATSGGTHLLRLASNDGHFNVDWLRLRQAEPSVSVDAFDDFDAGTAGLVVDGRIVIGTVLGWSGNGSSIYGNKGDVTGANGAQIVSLLPFALAADEAGVVEANLNPAGSSWMAVGFAQAPSQGWVLSASPQVWALLKPSGVFNVFANGTSHSLTGGERALGPSVRFRSDAHNQVRLVYDAPTRRAELWINGIRVLAPTPLPAGFTPAIAHAGIAGLSVTQNVSRADAVSIGRRAGAACAAPYVLTHPASTTATVGGSASWSVAVDGSAPLSYQWQKDTLDIAGATGNPYQRTNLQSGDAGRYRVRIASACGTVVSNIAELAINTATQTPFGGSAFTAPGLLQAENVDLGGEAVAYHDTTPTNLGGVYRSDGVDVLPVGNAFVLGVYDPTEWVEYTINAPAGGSYELDLRYSAGVPGVRTVDFELDGQALGSHVFASTNHWDVYHVVTTAPMSFAAGSNRVLRMTSRDGNLNIDWIRVRPAQPASVVRFADAFIGMANGAGLNGRVLPTQPTGGTTAWNANGSAIGGDRHDVTGANAAQPIATIPFTPSATLASSVEAQLNPASAEWLAVGFNAAPAQGFMQSGQVWALVKAPGRYDVFANGTATSLAGGEKDVPAEVQWKPNEANQVRLVYDAAWRRVTLWINGVQVLGPVLLPSGFTPSIAHVGFSGLAVTQNASRVDGFVVAERTAQTCATPIVTQAPVSQTVVPGSSVMFSVAADGFASLGYQWYRNGVALAGQTATQLQLNNVQAANAGNYHARVSNTCGAADSAPATLTVNTATQAPWGGSATALPGLLQAENVDVGGEAVAYHDTTPTNLGGVYRSDAVDVLAAGSGFVLGAYDPGEWVEYTVNVTATGSYDFYLRYSTAIDANTTLAFAWDGAPLFQLAHPPTYDWNAYHVRRMGPYTLSAGTHVLRMTSVDSNLNVDWIRVDAEPSSTVILADGFRGGATVGQPLQGRPIAGRAWGGNNTFTIGPRYDIGAVTAGHSVATIPYAASASMRSTLEAEINPAGSEWMAIGFAATPNPFPINSQGTVWALLKPGGTYNVFANGTTISFGELAVPAAAGFRAGEFNFVALSYDPVARQVSFAVNGVEVMAPTTLPAGYTPSLANIGLNGLNTSATTRVDNFALRESAATCVAPTVTTSPANVTATEGGSATFSGAASGSAPLAFQWQRNGVDIGGASGTNYTRSNLTSADAGGYRFRVANACGSVFSGTATLTVTANPQTPWGGTALVVPGLLQAENVDNGGEGIAYHETTPTNLGGVYRSDAVDVLQVGADYVLGVYDPTEWVEYTLNVPAGGSYDLDLRYSAGISGNRTLAFAVDGAAAGSVVLQSTNHWDVYHVATAGPITLAAGTRVLRLTSQDGNLNLDWVRLRPAQPAATVKLSDGFTGGIDGQGLNGRPVTISSPPATWNGNGSAIFGDRADVTAATAAQIVATAPFAASTTRASIVEAQLNPASAEWLALGFSSTPAQSFMGTGQIWVLVKSNGRYDVFANGLATSLPGGEQSVPAGAAFRGNAHNQVKLIYDPVPRRVELWINGVQVMAPTLLPTGFNPAIAHAGFAGLNVTRNVSRVDQFVARER